MKRTSLTPAQRRTLGKTLRETHDARIYKRVLGILELDRGRPAAQVAAMLQVARSSLYNWVDAFFWCPHPTSLQDRAGRGRPLRLNETLVAVLQAAMEQRPEIYGYPVNDWTVPLLLKHLERVSGVPLSDDTIRRQLHRMGYRWNRPRYILLPDPDLKKKASRPSGTASGAQSGPPRIDLCAR